MFVYFTQDHNISVSFSRECWEGTGFFGVHYILGVVDGYKNVIVFFEQDGVFFASL